MACSTHAQTTTRLNHIQSLSLQSSVCHKIRSHLHHSILYISSFALCARAIISKSQFNRNKDIIVKYYYYMITISLSSFFLLLGNDDVFLPPFSLKHGTLFCAHSLVWIVFLVSSCRRSGNAWFDNHCSSILLRGIQFWRSPAQHTHDILVFFGRQHEIFCEKVIAIHVCPCHMEWRSFTVKYVYRKI